MRMFSGSDYSPFTTSEAPMGFFHPHNHIKRRLTVSTSHLDIHQTSPSSSVDSPMTSPNPSFLSPQGAPALGFCAPPHTPLPCTFTRDRPPVFKGLHSPRVHESRCLSELAINLFVAFEDDRNTFDCTRHRLPVSEELTTSSGQNFTHVVAIRYGSPTNDTYESPIQCSFNRITAVHTLTLVIPFFEPLEEPAPVLYDSDFEMDAPTVEDSTLLTLAQLLALRQFISSTGYTLRTPNDYDSPYPEVTCQSQTRNARILITVPRDRRTDAVCAAVSFLAWDLEFQIEDVLENVSEDDEVLPVWRDVVGYETARFLKRALII